PVLKGASLTLRRGEIVALTGPNGIGKTTLAKIAAGLLTAERGSVERCGQACYLSQDPGRYLVTECAEDEVALAVGGDRGRACAAPRSSSHTISSSRARSPTAGLPSAHGSLRMPRLAALAAGLAAVASAAWVAVAPEHSGLPLLLAAMGLIVAGAAWLETGSG